MPEKRVSRDNSPSLRLIPGYKTALMLTFMGAMALLLGVLYFTIGGLALALGLGTVLLTLVIVGSFSLGSWWTHRVMVSEARIATAALDSRWGGHQSGSGHGPLPGPAYPPLLPPGGAIEVEFQIDGLEVEGQRYDRSDG